MKLLHLLLSGCIIYSCHTTARGWKNECLGYYQLMLPENVEVALYPISLILEPRKDPAWRKNTFTNRYLLPSISFGESRYQDDNDEIQAQFSQFHYGNYEIVISSENASVIDLLSYKKKFKERADTHIQDYWDTRKYEISIKLPVLSEEIATRSLEYSLETYNDAFSASDTGGYSLYINKNKRLYIFNKINETQSLDEQLIKNKPEIISLLKNFHSRNLFEVPAEKGFCLPYGFISGDSVHEPRNMAVTYRLKNHPDVTIFFQDLGTNPGPGERRPDPIMNAKEYVTDFWNVRYGHSFREIKLSGKGFTFPQIDSRKAVAAFAKFKRYSKEIDYGYVAFVKGTQPNEPDLLLYIMRDSRQAKDNPPIEEDELEKIAEHVTNSIHRR